MAKEIKFSLVYRDMWQSSGKYTARADQLAEIAPVIIDMGCFDRVETNGGAFEQVQLLYGQNPNKAVRAFTAPLHKAGIQTHMLDRGLNALRMYPCPVDVRKLMYKVKHAQGVDITRIFDGLNDANNIIPSIKYAIEGGMIPQASLCITYSPIHTVEYYTNLADKLIEAGAQEIALKDMAGIGRPWSLGQIVAGIKKKHPEILIQYHGHSGPGFSVASMLEVAKAGCDVLDVAIEPLSWGKIHPDVITIRAMLKDAGFKVKDINMKAYMEARALTQKFIDDFLGYFIEPTNHHLTSLLVGCGLPGGMMGSMMADLKAVHPAVNMYLRNNGKPEVALDDLVVKLFDEVEYVWPKVGYPPLVTPFSQYVKNIALMNIMAEAQGKPRYSLLTDKSIWGMILGRSGVLPGPVAPEIKELAEKQGMEFFTGDVQALYPDDMDVYRKEMADNGWELGQDDEELFELAMHPTQYRDYKNGLAAERFNKDLEAAKAKAGAPIVVTRPVVEVPKNDAPKFQEEHPKAHAVQAEAEGQVIWEYDVVDKSMAPRIGKAVKAGDVICRIQTPYALEDVKAAYAGKIVAVYPKQGDKVAKNEIIAFVE